MATASYKWLAGGSSFSDADLITSSFDRKVSYGSHGRTVSYGSPNLQLSKRLKSKAVAVSWSGHHQTDPTWLRDGPLPAHAPRSHQWSTKHSALWLPLDCASPGYPKSAARTAVPCGLPSYRRLPQTQIGISSSSGGAAMAEARLFGPSIFESQKLKVLFLGEDTNNTQHPSQAPQPRMYTLTHSDVTAKITLAVADYFNHNQFMSWYSRLLRDEVLAIWRHHCTTTITQEPSSEIIPCDLPADVTQACTCSDALHAGCQRRNECLHALNHVGTPLTCHTALHVHCHISGSHPLLNLVAALRFWIFRKELPVVLEAFMHGDRALLKKHPDLENALVWVHYHSNIPMYNTHECWGPLKDAPKVGAQLAKGSFVKPLSLALAQTQSEVASRMHHWPMR